MAENENVIVEELPVEPQPVNNEPSKGQKAKAKVKEWFRKRIVSLKRKPQNIALLFLAIVTIYFLLALYTISQAVVSCGGEDEVHSVGICIFVVTLLSLLVLVSFLNAFPKRKKPNIFFIVLVFVMIAAMIACDVVYYIQIDALLTRIGNPADKMYQSAVKGQPHALAHIILLGVSALVFALLPVYKRLINKINTKVELESAAENMQGTIDIQED